MRMTDIPTFNLTENEQTSHGDYWKKLSPSADNIAPFRRKRANQLSAAPLMWTLLHKRHVLRVSADNFR